MQLSMADVSLLGYFNILWFQMQPSVISTALCNELSQSLHWGYYSANRDGYDSDVLTTEEESMTSTFYSFPVSRISTTYIISPKYNRRYQAQTKFGAVSV